MLACVVQLGTGGNLVNYKGSPYTDRGTAGGRGERLDDSPCEELKHTKNEHS